MMAVMESAENLRYPWDGRSERSKVILCYMAFFMVFLFRQKKYFSHLNASFKTLVSDSV